MLRRIPDVQDCVPIVKSMLKILRIGLGDSNQHGWDWKRPDHQARQIRIRGLSKLKTHLYLSRCGQVVIPDSRQIQLRR